MVKNLIKILIKLMLNKMIQNLIHFLKIQIHNEKVISKYFNNLLMDHMLYIIYL